MIEKEETNATFWVLVANGHYISAANPLLKASLFTSLDNCRNGDIESEIDRDNHRDPQN